MKKLKLLLILIMFIVPISVKADHIYSIDMDIDIDMYGNANITEVWDVKADSGSEWFKDMFDLGNSKISNFVVFMDGVQMTYDSTWNINGTMRQKKGYYGINDTSDGIELCFGKGDMNRHIFTLKYTISNYIFNTDDSQVLYWTLIPEITLDNFSVDVTSYYSLPNNLDVWGYGYKGYAYVKDGKISMSNEKKLNKQKVVLLVKFPLNTFDISNINNKYNNFNDVYKKAKRGNSIIGTIFEVIFGIIFIIIFMLCFAFFSSIFRKRKKYYEYGYVGSVRIDENNVQLYKDIPCNKDIYYANALIKLNGFDYKVCNIYGAIVLKWVREGKIKFNNNEFNATSKKNNVIDLTLNPVFDNELEDRMFKMMYEASGDGYLEVEEFKKWSKEYYIQLFNLFDKMIDDKINELKNNNLIRARNDQKESDSYFIMNEVMYNDSVKLCGLKKYLENFSKIDTKEVIEVKLWDEYLMFAYLFGIADRVVKQLEDVYPDKVTLGIANSVADSNIGAFFHSFSFDIAEINELSRNVESYARSYSAGGGGISSDSGGDGSSGGGGSAGGR